MNDESIPYLIVSQALELGGEPLGIRAYVALNLLDHRAVGIALNKEEALQAMTEISDALAKGVNPEIKREDVKRSSSRSDGPDDCFDTDPEDWRYWLDRIEYEGRG